jgi:SAM-dependent methyltransferase
MKNEAAWRPSKYVQRGRSLRVTADAAEVEPGSRVIADLVANCYGQAIPLYVHGDLLDVGCGKVPLYGAYRPHVESITCIDWSESLHGDSFLDEQVDLSGPLPFADGSFDTIVLSDVLEHLWSPRDLMAEIRRVIRPGGVVLMNVPFMYWIHERPHDYFRYTRYALERMAEESGLDVKELSAIGGGLDVVVDTFGKLLRSAGSIGRGIARPVLWAAGLVVHSRIGSYGRRHTAETFPLGYFAVLQAGTP